MLNFRGVIVKPLQKDLFLYYCLVDSFLSISYCVVTTCDVDVLLQDVKTDQFHQKKDNQIHHVCLVELHCVFLQFPDEYVVFWTCGVYTIVTPTQDALPQRDAMFVLF